MVTSHPAIELRRLHRFFGDTRAVDDVSFQVEPGQVFGYIGPNGAGKTTSMRILATLDLPSLGDAFVDGFSVIDDPDRVRRRLGFMPDYFGVYANINCAEYLDFFARAYGLVGRERTQALNKVMSFTQLDQMAEKPINGLSKGMKQRLCLGRAIVHDPTVLVLDEPAAGLDPRARIELREMVGQLAADGKAILVSSHILTELAEMCDVVGIIEQGKLLATGSVEDILHSAADASEADATDEKRLAEVRIRVLGDYAPLAAWLEQRPNIADVRTFRTEIRCTVTGGRNAEADLLRDLINADFRVLEFGNRSQSLEHAFLHVTKGRVQ